ncbi:hypothetical protein A2634_05215 [Candidatus Amesbacteria bacterium RIFCSPHIGHO2_01_FULL_48_32]|uniref:DDH domain-containing protein n=1 Tax=Candidatus Amesbacteria bacterium RIFCSPLOWO2_01_FULL_48_25 TaxID=1797259 RepID=A0A1F4ZD12_9BACT|nr:MAG: hypothetical protein A2634_05215 [Candidatus Amesbacteria bacterium RIFCSPHIGHO2_01_FULL_48_32]OGD04068.1 MAG: hypothetical protein A2989_01560 [Candidatus Amesbacteria bacterium RIFCSPLOWO2_01_FULL_48_25]HJZ05668.1 bifunctional oligoribonuclease/PAP phosphatase NrnA [Patescibacteria group bacterium]
MSNKVKQLAPIIWSEIQKANSILLHCHPSPDGDSIGGVLAMMHVLKSLDKKVTVIAGDSEKPSSFSVLPGFDEIIAKNLTQTNLSEFDLFIIQDSSSLGQITKLAETKFPESLRTIVIDHHATNTEFANINLVDSTYPAVCQMIYDLFQEWKVEISPEAAVSLFVGIYSDTGGFKYQNTDANTLLAAAHLAKINPDFPKIIFELENNYEPEQIKFIGLCLTHIETYFFNRVAIAAVPYSVLQENSIRKEHTEKAEISNMLKSVKDWEIGIRFTEAEPGIVTLSFRTRNPDKHDVGKLAMATGFGGGHKSASGATFKMPFEQARKHLLETIQKVYPDLGEP